MRMLHVERSGKIVLSKMGYDRWRKIAWNDKHRANKE